MNILIDINHPAHVHMYHYFAEEMQRRGHKVLFVCRDKEFEVKLLTDFGFNFVNLGRKHSNLIGKIWDNIWFILRIWWIAIRFRADVLVSHGSLTATYVAKLTGKPHITFEDTFNMEQVSLYAPFAKVIFTADYDNPLVGRDNVLRYAGYKELLYLHPHWFTPAIEKLHMGSDPACSFDGFKGKFTIVRFVAWNATHDRGHRGLTLQNKIKAVTTFAKYGHVFISSEGALPAELEQLVNDPKSNISRFSLSPEWMHHAEAAASLIYGESSTMVAEGAVLGTPGIFLDNTGRLFTKDIEDKYGLCYNLTESEADQVKSIEIGERILSGQDGIDYKSRHEQLLHEKIDVTSMFCWFIEGYPETERLWRDNRDEIEKRFK